MAEHQPVDRDLDGEEGTRQDQRRSQTQQFAIAAGARFDFGKRLSHACYLTRKWIREGAGIGPGGSRRANSSRPASRFRLTWVSDDSPNPEAEMKLRVVAILLAALPLVLGGGCNHSETAAQDRDPEKTKKP